MKTLKPLEAPQRSVKIKIQVNFYFKYNPLKCTGARRVNKVTSDPRAIHINKICKVQVVSTVLSFVIFTYTVFIWDKVFKDGPSKICGRQPSKNFTWFILEYFGKVR